MRDSVVEGFPANIQRENEELRAQLSRQREVIDNDSRTIKTLNEAVADLKEQLNAATTRGNDLQSECDALGAELRSMVKRFDLSLARGQLLVESVAALSKSIEKMTDTKENC
jgi:chromosome segregation ATPase